MTPENDNFDKILEQLVASTRSPRGRFSAKNSWKILERRISPASGKIKFLRIAGSVAASILICLASWYTYDYIQSGTIQTISTLAEIRDITLPDQSVVTLNRYSTLSFPSRFRGAKREVRLTGEAYFDVAKDKKRPFIVETGKCNMEVLGTKFNVEGYSDKDDFEVTLMEGSVRVASRIGLGDTLMLKPDSKACLQKDGRLKVIPVDDYNPYRWKEGLICFRNESFLSIMSDLEKYFGVSIVVENKNVLKYYFTGKFRQADGIDYALRVLQRDIRFKYERDDENQIIYIR